MNYIVHDFDGNILRTGWCSEQDLQLQALPGETAIADTSEEITRDTKHGIIDGQKVERAVLLQHIEQESNK